MSQARVGILHGAGYTGAELIRLVLGHPHASLAWVTSRTFAGQPLATAHPHLAGATDLRFSTTAADADVVFTAAEHGQGAVAAAELFDAGFEGVLIDLSADFRLADPAEYERRYGSPHPAPHLAGSFAYGMADLLSPYPENTRRIANPGCFATGLALAARPVADALRGQRLAITALTGASGSGARPSTGTHFPTREGNVRAYKVLKHQHLPEVLQVLPPGSQLDFVPVSGPWTRGIWGTLHAQSDASLEEVSRWFQDAYADRPLVRLWPGQLPELRWSVGTSFVDLGWMVDGQAVIVGFALDNLLKGASGQAVQNMNLAMGWPETAGLVPDASVLKPSNG